jgi:hypothetical protein
MDDFAFKMEPYYADLELPSNTRNASLRKLPNTYWGATVWAETCTSQVYLDERFTHSSHPFHGTPMWKYVLAHEWAHVAQGRHCWDNELEAQLIGLAVLAEAGEWGAVITALEWMFTLSVPDSLLTELDFPPQEAAYYRAVDLPGTGIVEFLLDDGDGIFELRTGRLEARSLWILISHLQQINVEFKDFSTALNSSLLK